MIKAVLKIHFKDFVECIKFACFGHLCKINFNFKLFLFCNMHHLFLFSWLISWIYFSVVLIMVMFVGGIIDLAMIRDSDQLVPVQYLAHHLLLSPHQEVMQEVAFLLQLLLVQQALQQHHVRLRIYYTLKDNVEKVSLLHKIPYINFTWHFPVVSDLCHSFFILLLCVQCNTVWYVTLLEWNNLFLVLKTGPFCY